MHLTASSAQKQPLLTAGTGNAKQKPCNASAWISISDFLDAQFLASFGLKRVARKGPACGKGPREAHPVGNTGGTSQIPKTGRGVLAPVLVGFNRG